MGQIRKGTFMELQIFSNEEFGEVRMTEIDGKPYFVATDVATALGYINPRKAVNDHCKGVTKRDTPTSSGVQQMSYINEGDLYRLIMKSKLPSAEKFESWVMDEVLPSIRKTGSYQKQLSPQEMMRIQLGMLDDVSDRVSKLENTMNIDYGQQKVLNDLVSARVIKILGGKDSNAYKEISKKVFAEINHDYKDYFNVNSRANTPRLKNEQAVEYVKNWMPSTNTMMLIKDCNAQMNFEN